ncbi:MAG: PEP-CTERM sorting domain-containing protein [Betaproteobacteria bacterium]|nr:PEP-CTERM sorting domain-containing protein [Betaproteobacteria bacterium]
MKTRNPLSVFALILGLAISAPAAADIVADWGTVATPITSETSFSFAQYNISNNFTDQYAFSLEGASGASYSVTFQFDTCKNGCGNPDLSYGIYDSNGGLVASATGTVTLSAGTYVFQVKGDGMGSGNSVDYWGSVTFSAVATSMVSPAPEPSSLALMLFGMGGLGWAVRRRRAGPDHGDCAGRIMFARAV